LSHFAFLLLLATSCLAPALAGSDPKPGRLPLPKQDLEKLLRTDYYGAYILGKKVGWARMSLVRLPDGQAYSSELEMNMKLTALGAKTETRSLTREEFDARPPYAFRGG